MLTTVKFFKEQRFDFSLVAMIWILNAVTFTYKAVKHKKKAYYNNGFKCSLTSKIQKIISKTPINDKKHLRRKLTMEANGGGVVGKKMLQSANQKQRIILCVIIILQE